MNVENWKKLWSDPKLFFSILEGKGNTFIQSLLDAGLDVNALNNNGATMLSCAAECGNLEIVEFLVQKGADGNFTNFDGCKPLHIAAKCGHKDIVKFFLSIGIFVDTCDNDNCTPLHYVALKRSIPLAATENYQELVHFLIDNKADLNAVNRNGYTPLLLAAQNSRKDIIELFIKYGANVECCDENQWTVLHHSSASGLSQIVWSLIEGRFDIDLNSRTSQGYTPLMIAADSSHKDIVELLIEAGASVEGQGCKDRTLLHCACKEGWLDIVKSLVDIGCDLNPKDCFGETPLLLAAHGTYFKVVEYLIESGADAECCDQYMTVLHYACIHGWFNVVKCLACKGFDLNSKSYKGETPLWIAAKYSHFNIVEYLIDEGADFNCCIYGQWPLLHYASIQGLLGVVRSLVSKGSDFNAKFFTGETPLLMAAEASHYNIVKYLIESGADVQCCNQDEWTVLHFACEKAWFDIVKYVVNTKCDLNSKSSTGDTPLLVAAEASRYNIVKYLIESGAYIQCCNQDEWTLLHFACEKGWLDIVKYVIKNGCDLNSKSSSRDTPLLVAAKASHSNVVEYLIESGADIQCCNQDEWTLLHFACEKGWFDIVKYVIKNGCDLNSKSDSGDTPVLMAAKASQGTIVEYLIGCGADVECCDQGEWTVLHYSCIEGWLDVVKYFIEKEYYLDSRYHYSPLHLAVLAGNLEIMEHLLKAGANCNIESQNVVSAFHLLIKHPLCLKGILLFLENGAYIQPDDYVAICRKPSLKEGILQDVNFCTLSVMNKFNNADLPKMYQIPAIAEYLPPIQKLKIVNYSNVEQHIAQSITYEIQTAEYCNVLNVRPMALNVLCVRSLVERYYNRC